MASPRGRGPWQLVLLMLAVKQMALLGEAGRPFFGYGDEGGVGPQMDEHYDFRCNTWPVRDEGPPPYYSERGMVRKGTASKLSRTRQWVYYCVVGKGKESPQGDYHRGGYDHPPPPRPREIRSGPYFLPGGPVGPPHIPDYYPHVPFHYPTGQYERPYSGGPPMGGGGRGYGPADEVSRPTKKASPYFPGGPSRWDDSEEDCSGFPSLEIRGLPPKGYAGGPSSQMPPDRPEEKPRNGPDSRAPIQFSQTPPNPYANGTSTAPRTRTQPRKYSPYMRYGLQLIQ